MTSTILKRLLVNKDSSIKTAMKVIDRGTLGIAFIVDRKRTLLGVVSDGEIRRAILKGINIEKPISEIMNKKPIFIKGSPTKNELLRIKTDKSLRKRMQPAGSLKVPLVDDAGRVKDVIFIYDNKKNTLAVQKKAGMATSAIRRVLIVGGAGYLGSVLTGKLLDRNFKVRILDNLTYGDEGIKQYGGNKNFELIVGDIRNISDVIGALEGIDAVIHLAAIVGDPASAIDPRKTIEINYLSTKAVAEACKFNQINKFLFASTCSVYGASKDTKERLKENSALNPVSLYAETKLKSEEGILGLADENFSPTIFRFATLYGVSPRMRFDLVVNLLSAKALTDKKFSIFGGNQWRPNLDVNDAAEACSKWVSAPIEKVGGEIINVGSDEQNCRIVEIGHKVKKIIPDSEMEVNEGQGDFRDYNVSFEKAVKLLSFRPQNDIECGIVAIKKLLSENKISNLNDPKYNNYRFLARGNPSSRES